MKTIKILSLAIFAFVIASTTGKAAYATPVAKYIVCHATESSTNPYNRLDIAYNAYLNHCSEQGTPLAGHETDICDQAAVDQYCPATPVVPEFGLITGAVALVSSGGAMYLLKRKSQ